MDAATFGKLTFGNIVSEAGRKLGVTNRLQDSTGATKAIFCGGEAFQLADAPVLTLVSSDYLRTVIVGSPDGPLMLKGETVQVP
jgi:hypothetical protein